jgi:hypothetical protein
MLRSVLIAYVLPSIVSETVFQKLDDITVCTANLVSVEVLFPSWPYPLPPQPYKNAFKATGVGSGVADGEGDGVGEAVGVGVEVN